MGTMLNLINDDSNSSHSFMIKYYIDSNSGCIFVYNEDTDHWIMKSPDHLLDTSYRAQLLNDSDLRNSNFKTIGKVRAQRILIDQYRDLEEIWEWNGDLYKSGKNLISGDTSYNIIYYQGSIYPIRAYIIKTDSFILRKGKMGRFTVSAKDCAPIYKAGKNGEWQSYGQTII